MKVNVFFCLIIFLICGCSVSRKYEISPMEETAEEQKPVFFVSVPITKFSSIQSPCVEIDIKGIIFSMKLDLGFRGDLSIAQNLIAQVPSKTFIRTKPMYGIKGKQYLMNLYRIPKVKIGEISFIQPFLQEDPPEFFKDAVFVENGGEPSPGEPGTLGWELFYNVNLLVDIKNSKIAFCDSLDTLKKQGYATEAFVKTHLLLERGLVEFEAQTPGGILRCTLDTGATYNMLNGEVAGNKPIEQAIWDPDNLLKLSSFQIAGYDFGSISFHRVPIKMPIQIEAFVGMEFIRNHLIFLDFSGGYIYFAKDH